ncbi:MAG: sigma-70 family RNA polymerase sigma factor [Phycisphaerae bacterium]|nr:sigma-70 family RNA polymerase sigma factor [Phycisphaerae bacterium]
MSERTSDTVRPLREDSPEALAVRAQRGSRDAFAALVEAMHARLHSFIVRRTGCPHEAEDVCQEAFIRAWERLSTYHPKWRFSTWLFTIAGRIAISRARTRRPTAALSSAEPSPATPPPGVDSSIWTLVDRELSGESAAALWLKYGEGMEAAEIARVLGKTEGGVRVMLHRARGALARHIEPDGSPAVPSVPLAVVRGGS